MTGLGWARTVACNGNGQRLVAVREQDIWIMGSTDYGNTWTKFNHPMGSWVTYESVVVDTSGMNIVVGGWDLKAVIGSSDGGATWSYITPVGASFNSWAHRLVGDESARYLLLAQELKMTMNPLVAASTTAPSAKPTFSVTASPSNRPTTTPSRTPSAAPSRVPSANLSAVPSAGPSATPSAVPSAAPSTDPSAAPSADPSLAPSADPTTDPSVDPSAAPSFNPSAVPSAAPSTVCLQWVLGAPKESCSATCAAVSRTCSAHHFLDVVSAGDFSDMVGSSIDGAGGGAVGSVATYCSQGTNGWPSVGGPVSVSALLHQSTGDVVQTHCTYPTSTSGVTLGCEDALTAFPSRRFCPCVRDTCDGAWHLGYTGESCTATCSQTGGVCQNSATAAITTSAAFDAMVSTATSLETGAAVGSASTFCTAINAPAFGTAPAAVTISMPLGASRNYCAHPTAASESTCDTEFTYPPAQRFCYCQVGGRRLREQMQAEQPVAPLQQQKLRTRKF